MEKSYKYQYLTKEDRQFNLFLDRTIIGTAYNYFNENKRKEKDIVEYQDDMVADCPNEVCLLNEVKNKKLRIAMKSLTKKERSVISFIFEDKLKGEEIARILKINQNTVYIIKKRAIKKLEKLIKEIEKDGSYKIIWIRKES